MFNIRCERCFILKELNDANFDEFIKSEKTVVVDFWADWCGPCKMVGPIFEELSEELNGKLEFGKFDITDNPKTPTKFGVVSIPNFIIFKNGEKIGELHGAMVKEDFKAKLEEFI